MRMWIQSLALFSGFRIQCCCELWCSRPAAAALIWSLAWELPYAPGAALKRKKRKKKKGASSQRWAFVALAFLVTSLLLWGQHSTFPSYDAVWWSWLYSPPPAPAVSVWPRWQTRAISTVFLWSQWQVTHGCVTQPRPRTAEPGPSFLTI